MKINYIIVECYIEIPATLKSGVPFISKKSYNNVCKLAKKWGRKIASVNGNFEYTRFIFDKALTLEEYENLNEA